MGLITKEVEVKLGARNIKYYENLGYKIPRYKNTNGKMCVEKGATINVNIDDLSQGSNVEVEYECDMCHKIIKTRYDVYSKHNNNGITYCLSCNGKISSSKFHPHLFKKNQNNKNSEQKETRKNSSRFSDPNYIIFMKKVLARDSYKCQCCGDTNNLEVHHLDGYNWCKEKRTDETNGISLCVNCHANFHSKYGRGDNTKKQFEEWIGKAGGE